MSKEPVDIAWLKRMNRQKIVRKEELWQKGLTEEPLAMLKAREADHE